MKLVIRLLAGLAIAALSIVISVIAPRYAWSCGWLGACFYYVLIVRR